MGNETYLVIGLMSGTSVDAVDAALIETDGEGHVVGISAQGRPFFRFLHRLACNVGRCRSERGQGDRYKD